MIAGILIVVFVVPCTVLVFLMPSKSQVFLCITTVCRSPGRRHRSPSPHRRNHSWRHRHRSPRTGHRYEDDYIWRDGGGERGGDSRRPTRRPSPSHRRMSCSPEDRVRAHGRHSRGRNSPPRRKESSHELEDMGSSGDSEEEESDSSEYDGSSVGSSGDDASPSANEGTESVDSDTSDTDEDDASVSSEEFSKSPSPVLPSIKKR